MQILSSTCALTVLKHGLPPLLSLQSVDDLNGYQSPTKGIVKKDDSE
jgi:hypothetical protein